MSERAFASGLEISPHTVEYESLSGLKRFSPPGGGYTPGATVSGANPAGTITALA
ncbi:hypothetical protein PHLCEN_2v13423 [Hermanssonia centrifuga]|uniref:Uncharacterized protein n=1 Tax=Hermanssonia centrifuga TaxID=98765 RepID=A0A2R6NEA1_9APHY|nr:hypothetical protein PHLCEN_2v13423 [Hermanssonia centrifuga]